MNNEKYNNNDLPKTQKEREIYCKDIFDYLSKLSNNVEDRKIFLIIWMATIIQFPHIKTEVAIAMISEAQGMGKNFFYKLMTKLLGEDNTILVDNLDSVFSRFANARLNKLFIFCDEVEYRESKEYESRLKNAITEASFNYEVKGISPSVQKSYENYVGASNKLGAFQVEGYDRRYDIRIIKNDIYGSLEEKKKYFDNLGLIIMGNPKKNILPNYTPVKNLFLNVFFEKVYSMYSFFKFHKKNL